MLYREGEQLELCGSMLENVRPVLELLLVSCAWSRDSSNSFLNPDTWDIPVLSMSFTSMGKLHMHIHIKIVFFLNAFYLY